MVSQSLRQSVVPGICPKCNAPALHRSSVKTQIERVRRNLSEKRKYRCHSCDWHGWMSESSLRYPSVSQITGIPVISNQDVDIPPICLESQRSDVDSEQRESRDADDARMTSDTEMHDSHYNHAPVENDTGPVGDSLDNAASGEPRDVMGGGLIPEVTNVEVRVPQHHLQQSSACTACGGNSLLRSRTRGTGEWLRKLLTKNRPYRCRQCGWRGWVKKRY